VLSEFVPVLPRPEHWRTSKTSSASSETKREGIFGDLIEHVYVPSSVERGLVCTGPGGTFVLELQWDGCLHSAHEDAWQKKAPAWARDLWPVAQLERESWCRVSKAIW